MNTDTVAELTRIEQQIAQAWVNGDQQFIDNTLADDWSVTDPTGRILTKAEVLREAFTGEREITESMSDGARDRETILRKH